MSHGPPPRPRTHVGYAALVYAPLAATVLLSGYLAGRAVDAGLTRLLREETAVAAQLMREEGGASLLDRFVFFGRWRILEPAGEFEIVEPTVVTGPDGMRGRAGVYDADGWYTVGMLELRPGPIAEEVDGRPWSNVAVTVLALVALLPVAVLATDAGERRGKTGRRLVAVAVPAVLLPVTADALWAREALTTATQYRLATAINALEVLDDPRAVIDRPGGAAQLTGLQLILFDDGGGVELTTLPPAPTADLAAAPTATSRARADDVTYAVTDVGRVRLVMVPYEHVLSPGARLAATAGVGGLVAWLMVFLAGLRTRPRALRREVVAWTFLAPSALHLAVFTVGPLAFAGWLSLHRWSLIDEARPLVWLANYRAILRDGAFWNAMGNTALYTLHVPVAMAVALGLALLVHRNIRGALALRTLLFLPTITSLVAVAVAWQWMFNQEYGLINWALSLVGVAPIPWLDSPATALPALMLMAVWLVVGYQVVLFQAGLTTIPGELYDAARIDGAPAWRRFVHVTLPGLRHTLFFVLVTSVIGSFQVFGAVYVMTEGGPLRSTDVAVFHIYEEAWDFLRFGSAAAMSWVLFAIIFAVTWLHFRALERRLESAA